MAVPHLIDSEVAHVFRGLARRSVLTQQQATTALDGFSQLSLTRFSADWLRPRIWELCHNLTGYDATYVALAETIEATALLTTDQRLAGAPGVRCRIVIL